MTIRFSHYNERARWALDRAGIAYEEEPHLPLFHMPAVFLASRGRGGRGDRVSTPFSTPLLRRVSGELLQDSGDILHYACRKSGEELYPDPSIPEIEKRLHNRLGPHGRRVTYFFLLQSPELLHELARNNVSGLEATLFSVSIPLVQVLMRKLLKINEPETMRSMEIVRTEFEWIGELLGDKPYLCGDTFSAADLTFASMAAAVIQPGAGEGYGATLFPRERLDDGARRVVEEFRATKAGQHALRMFAEERGTRIVDCEPPLDLHQRW